MKKLSFLVIFSLFGLLWVASANPSKNTREEMGLKGEVSSLVIKTVQMEIKFHKAEESERSLTNRSACWNKPFGYGPACRIWKKNTESRPR